jgi:hypothetical protein
MTEKRYSKKLLRGVNQEEVKEVSRLDDTNSLEVQGFIKFHLDPMLLGGGFRTSSILHTAEGLFFKKHRIRLAIEVLVLTADEPKLFWF